MKQNRQTTSACYKSLHNSVLLRTKSTTKHSDVAEVLGKRSDNTISENGAEETGTKGGFSIHTS